MLTAVKLIIQIPCYNEEQVLPQTLADLPTHVDGVDTIERLVIDDGSTDRTSQTAREFGVEHIVRHSSNKGLAAAFQTGLDAALRLGADIIVNTDADNQYPGRYVSDLVRPILREDADMVIGNRQTDRIQEFSFVKKLLQRVGSAVVRAVSGTGVPDAPSGFRALSREAALRMNVLTGYTYTLETIIQAGKKNLTIANVPIETNAKTRDSRLVRGSWSYARRQAMSILRLFILYEPLRTFVYLGLPFFLFGIGLWLRYLVLLIGGGAGGHIQSVVVGAVAILMAVLLWSLGMVGELLATNRRLQEETLYHLKREALHSESLTEKEGAVPARRR